MLKSNKRIRSCHSWLAAAACLALWLVAGPAGSGFAQSSQQHAPHRLQALFLGDDGHHDPAQRLRQVLPKMAGRGIFLSYMDELDVLKPQTLSRFDVLVIYGNKPALSADQERALLDFVAKGGGLVAIHSASACFSTSDAYISLVGGAFKSHGYGTFRTKVLQPGHPVMQGVPNFESWDETYVHMKHNLDKTVLSVRVAGDGHEEPWTWVRTHGEGRVFYTAWGHDARTWSKPGFQKLIERGIRWAAGGETLEAALAPPNLNYVPDLASMEGEGQLPYYPPDSSWGVTGAPITELQEPLSPEASMEQMAVEPGFRVELFAAEPDIVNPIDMTWDRRGRLWVVEALNYPSEFTPEGQGDDRIKILEDTNDDGKADKITVFADGLNLATSLTLANGGVVVAQMPDVLFLKDTDGDGRADVRNVLFSGFGTFDTHAGPSNLQYGFDNHIWGAVGYSGFQGVIDGDSLEFAQGFYRFLPDGSALEYMATTNNNTWGLGFTEEGLVFGSTANDNPAVHMAIPNRFYQGVRGWGPPTLGTIAASPMFYPITDKVRQVDQHGRYTAAAGFHFYTARDFPEAYWNRIAFVSGPTGHLLGKFTLDPEGSGFVAHNAWNMLAGRDAWFAPIQAKVGPDGALWLIDWYDLIIQHNPTPEGYETGKGNAYQTGLRDDLRARIYRIVWEDAEADEPFSLEDATPEALVQALAHENLFWRLTAQRLLVERGETDVLPMLYTLVQDETIDAVGLSPGALHALWTMHGLGVLDGSNAEALTVATSALYHPSSAVRRAALMVLPRTAESREAILKAGFLPDTVTPEETEYIVPVSVMEASDPQVRLAALLALAEMPPADHHLGEAIAELLTVPENANDRWLSDAATAVGARHSVGLLSAMLRKELPPRADSAYAANVSSVVHIVAQHYAMGVPADSLMPLLLAVEQAEPAFAGAFLEGLAAGWPEGAAPALSETERSRLKALWPALPAEQAEPLEQLAERWGWPNLFAGTK